MIAQTKLKQHPERSVPEEAENILSKGMVAHVGFSSEDRTYVIPMTYVYDVSRPDRIYIHGGKSSRLMRVICSGVQVCVEVTLLDGLVYSKSAKYHSMNYRSVICFGRGREVESLEAKEEILKHGIERYFPGRAEGKDYEKAPVEHLAATTLAEITIEEWSAKTRVGGPKGPFDADPAANGSCGVVSTLLA